MIFVQKIVRSNSMVGELKLSKIENFNDNRMPLVMDIYKEAFPIHERQLDETIYERQKSGFNEIYVLENLGNIVYGIAFLFPVSNTDFILLDYFAIKLEYRFAGLGSILLGKLKILLRDRQKSMIIEVEKPLDKENKIEQEKRIQFYKKNGALLLIDTPYFLPSITNHEPVEMQLMLLNDYTKEYINGILITDLIKKIYSQVYGVKSDDKFLSAFLHNIPKLLTLES